MESYQFAIKSNEDAFDLKRSGSEILINGISIPLDDIVEYTSSSQGYSGPFVNHGNSFVRVATKTKQVTVTQGRIAIFGVDVKKQQGASLFNSILVSISDIVTPRLLFNALKALAEGHSLTIGPFRITREGLFTKKMFSEKFCSWDWNVRADIGTKTFNNFFSPNTERSFGETISFTSPETNSLEEFGFLKSGEANSTILTSLCILLGKRKDEHIYKMFDTSSGAESAEITLLKDNFVRLISMPESALKRRLAMRFPELSR